MRKTFSLLLISTICCAAILGCFDSEEQYHAQMVGRSLRSVYKDWRIAGEPSDYNITNRSLYVGHTTNQVFFFTNQIRVNRADYHCRLALRSPTKFEKPGIMVLTDEGVLLWIGDDGKMFVSPDKGPFSSREVR